MKISGMDGVQYKLFKRLIDNLFTKIRMEEVLALNPAMGHTAPKHRISMLSQNQQNVFKQVQTLKSQHLGNFA